jgi:hypothetical protein
MFLDIFAALLAVSAAVVWLSARAFAKLRSRMSNRSAEHHEHLVNVLAGPIEAQHLKSSAIHKPGRPITPSKGHSGS